MKTKETLMLALALSGTALAAVITIPAAEMVKAPMLFICAFGKAITQIIGPIAVMLLVAVGANYIYNADNQSIRAESKERIKQILMGLIIILIGRATITLLVSILGGTMPSC